jgi:multiple sugar transport system permease protein
MFEYLNKRQKLPSLTSYRSLSPLGRREMRNGLIFLTPWLVGFLAFTLLPTLATLLFSFLDRKVTDSILATPHFVGLANFKQLVTDPQIWSTGATRGSLWVTVRFALIALPIGIFFPLGIALLMNNPNLRGQNFFRSLFYMPFIVPFVAAIYLWGGMLNPASGWINRVLAFLGVAQANLPLWANGTSYLTGVYPAYVIIGIWGLGNAMLIFLSGLQGVPTELYDAAKVDGANSWQTFWNITFPMISPVIFYNLVLGLVGIFQFFQLPLVINQGNGLPGGWTMFYNLYLYRTFFTYQNMGYGSSMAWFLFLVILLVTIVLFSTAKYWVYYAGESR